MTTHIAGKGIGKVKLPLFLTKHHAMKTSLCLTKQHAIKTFGAVEVQPHTFLTSALDGGEWSVSHSHRSTPWVQLRYPLDRSLGVTQSLFGRGGEENKPIISVAGN